MSDKKVSKKNDLSRIEWDFYKQDLRSFLENRKYDI